MPEKISIDLGNVQKTLFLPLWGRAYESKKESPLLVDRTALEIIDKVDYDFSTIAQNISPLTQLAWIMRSNYVDEVINNFTAQYPAATIVNIGCGLDTTFERTDNGALRWYDLDLPDVIQLRQQFIKENERRKFIAGSFLEEHWLEELKGVEHILFIAAGVFYYFEEAEIKSFLVRIADHFPGCQVLFDASSPAGVKVANKKVISSSGLDERSFLKWGLERSQDLLAWDKRIRIVKEYFYFKGKLKYLSPRIWLIGLISDRMRIQYMIQLEMAKS
jgi:O-methyltransferase involved in polyketide biosynthesis